jgi:hypothetical protein
MKNTEPSLEAIDDYKKPLKGSKKRTIWFFILIGLLIGVIYTTVNKYYGQPSDEIPTSQKIGTLPAK